jgi:hypothetical protein
MIHGGEPPMFFRVALSIGVKGRVVNMSDGVLEAISKMQLTSNGRVAFRFEMLAY